MDELQAVPPANPLAPWCREIERRLAEAQGERGQLAAENEQLAARIAELTAVLKSLEEAYLLGQLRAAGKFAPAPPVRGGGGEATGVPAGEG